MNGKSKVFGLLAAIGLTLSMFGGVAAQSSDSEWVNVELTDSGGYICSLNLFTIGGSFGMWDFDGVSYVETTGNSTLLLGTDIFGGSATGCDVSISFWGLSNWMTGEWIDPSYFSAYSDYQGAGVDPWGFGDTGVPNGLNGPNVTYYDFEYTLNSVPMVSAGLYEGSIDAFVSNTP